MAIQFASKMGCRVVVLSGSDRKKDEATRLGAHRFIAMAGRTATAEIDQDSLIDRLLVTTSAQPDWEVILPMMATRSSIYPLSASQGSLEFPYMPLLLKGIAIQGSLVASRSIHREMLRFAAFHQVAPVIETFPMTEAGIVEALDKLEHGQIHFRGVLLPAQ